MCCLSQGLVWFLDEESEVAMAFALLSLPCGWGKETTHTCPCSEQARQETKDENLESVNMVSRAWRRQRKPLHESDFFQDWGARLYLLTGFFLQRGCGSYSHNSDWITHHSNGWRLSPLYWI